MKCTFYEQDEPLAHELRPLPTLEMTMTYLLCEVADQGQEGYWGDWFDFLWNRMRGIRKVSRIYMGLCERKPVFRVSDQLTLYSDIIFYF